MKKAYNREKDNTVNLKYEISLIINSIKKRYTALIIACYIIFIISWYYVTCFYNVYPNMFIEWIKSSITIFIIMQIIGFLFVLMEGILRFISFRNKSEKIFKASKLFN